VNTGTSRQKRSAAENQDLFDAEANMHGFVRRAVKADRVAVNKREADYINYDCILIKF
jgi:hypothetical protein